MIVIKAAEPQYGKWDEDYRDFWYCSDPECAERMYKDSPQCHGWAYPDGVDEDGLECLCLRPPRRTRRSKALLSLDLSDLAPTKKRKPRKKATKKVARKAKRA